MKKYNVETPKTYLIFAVILLVLGLWHIWDGWFPREAVLLEHPLAEDPNYYVYNKVTGVLLTLGGVVCGYIHRVINK